jgi:hypothetical protein
VEELLRLVESNRARERESAVTNWGLEGDGLMTLHSENFQGT